MAAPKAVEHLTPDERAARGRAARTAVPRANHAGWDRPAKRTNPVTVLKQQAKTAFPNSSRSATRG